VQCRIHLPRKSKILGAGWQIDELPMSTILPSPFLKVAALKPIFLGNCCRRFADEMSKKLGIANYINVVAM
jgi:hypothetical protein